MNAFLGRVRSLAGPGLLLVLLSASAVAAGQPLPEARDGFAVQGMRVPLPGGAWSVVAEAEQRLAVPGPDPGPALHGAVLASLSGTTVTGLVVIQAIAEGEGIGSGRPSECDRADLHWTESRSGAGSLLAVCSYVTHVVQAVSPDSAVVWREADQSIRGQGWIVPDTWLAVGFRIADDIDLLDVRYYFNPDLLGLPPAAVQAQASGGWLDVAASAYRSATAAIVGGGAPHDPRWLASPWSPAAVAGDASREAAIRGLVAWAHPALRALRSGFAGRETALGPPPPPWTASPESGQGARSGAAEAVAPKGSALALWKTLSWRAVGSTLDLLVSFSVTGNAGAAGAITFIGAAVNSVGYYLHELAWQAYEGSRAVRTAVDDLPPSGIDF